MTRPDASVVVLGRLPHPGRAKTRLIAALGSGDAARLHAAMMAHTLRNARAFAAGSGVRIELQVDGDPREARRAGLGRGLAVRRQAEGDLGGRILAALLSAFHAGASRAVVVGTDCPDLDGALLAEALAALDAVDVVLGPACDGGYYLVAARPHPALSRLFEGIPWGTDEVLALTQEAAAGARLTVRLLRTLPDVDRPEDLAVWERHASPRSISVVVPALNEAASIATALAPLAAVDEVEVVVADGGSTDRTREVAAECGARVVRVPRGRAGQQNAGASVASGDILVFLHADTVLPDGFAPAVRAALADPAVALGAFRFATDLASPAMRAVEAGAGLRSRWLALPYGDQALFMRADTFRSLGGFRELPVMEDYDLAVRARSAGTVVTLPLPAVTSGRRWRERGAIRWSALNLATVAAWRLGVPADRLASWRSQSKR